jgi:hypothetical protein
MKPDLNFKLRSGRLDESLTSALIISPGNHAKSESFQLKHSIVQIIMLRAIVWAKSDDGAWTRPSSTEAKPDARKQEEFKDPA